MRFTNPGSLAWIGTARYGWNSPGSLTCRSTAFAVTRTTSTGAGAGAAPGGCAAAVAANSSSIDAIASLCLCAFVIVCARGVIGIQRGRYRADSRLHEGIYGRKNNERRHGRQEQAADDRTAQW